MFFLFTVFSLSTIECPIGTTYYHNQKKNGTIAPKEWFYLMTSHTKANDRPYYFFLTCDNDLTVFQSKSADCPDDGDIMILEAKKGKLNKVQLQVYNEYGFINLGIQNGPNPTNFEFELYNELQKKVFWTPLKKILVVLFVMFAGVVGFFIYVTNPEPEHEKND